MRRKCNIQTKMYSPGLRRLKRHFLRGLFILKVFRMLWLPCEPPHLHELYKLHIFYQRNKHNFMQLCGSTKLEFGTLWHPRTKWLTYFAPWMCECRTYFRTNIWQATNLKNMRRFLAFHRNDTWSIAQSRPILQWLQSTAFHDAILWGSNCTRGAHISRSFMTRTSFEHSDLHLWPLLYSVQLSFFFFFQRWR